MKKHLTRIYHPYWLWEEIDYNMWGTEENKVSVEDVKTFMENTSRFAFHMKIVADNWKYSCEHNLSNTEQNRIAWLGQAACALALKASSDLVKNVWWLVDEELRNKADEEAQKVINYWEKKYAKKKNK